MINSTTREELRDIIKNNAAYVLEHHIENIVSTLIEKQLVVIKKPPKFKVGDSVAYKSYDKSLKSLNCPGLVRIGKIKQIRTTPSYEYVYDFEDKKIGFYEQTLYPLDTPNLYDTVINCYKKE